MRKLLLHVVAATFTAAPLAWSSVSQPDAAPQPVPNWDAYWLERGVRPPPPRNFLEGEFNGKLLNLTEGRLSDATVRMWVLADLRRGRGDSWATCQLRLDITNADVFGPPGLNGTGAGVERALERGAVSIDAEPTFETVAAAVVTVSKQLQADHPELGLTDYVVVLMNRSTGKPTSLVFTDGHKEPFGAARDAGELRWQLDTGAYVADRTVGGLWYQLRGWACKPDDGSVTGELCGLLKP